MDALYEQFIDKLLSHCAELCLLVESDDSDTDHVDVDDTERFLQQPRNNPTITV
jgi:hypothetical protein